MGDHGGTLNLKDPVECANGPGVLGDPPGQAAGPRRVIGERVDAGNLGHDGTILWTAAEERLSVDAGVDDRGDRRVGLLGLTGERPPSDPADDDDGVHALPPLPVVPAAEAAAQLDRRDGEREDEPVAPPRPRRPAATPAAKRAPRPRKPKATPPPPPDVPPAAAARFEAAAPLSSIEPDELPPRPADGTPPP
jgi:hypothetical protein